MTAGLLLVIAGVSRTEVVGWLSASTLGCILGGLALIAGFIAIELRTVEPLVDLRIFKRRTLRGANIVALLCFGAMTGFYFVGSLLLQRVFGYSALDTGFA